MNVLLLRDVVAILLAGGAGERLYPLTRERAKPAVPFGGPYRIIDFTLSNCINSGLRKIFLATQYKAQSLNRHVRMGWNVVNRELGEFIEILPPQKRMGEHWYLGTADAVWQNMHAIERERPRWVIVLAGDHIYKMDYGKMLDVHIARGARLTVAAIEVPLADAQPLRGAGGGRGRARRRLPREAGDGAGRALEPGGLPRRPWASTSSTWTCWCASCSATRSDDSTHDFGRDIIPRLVAAGERVFAYLFWDENKKQSQYWRDVGTIDAYYEASMDLIQVDPVFNLYDPDWPMRTYQPQLPPAKFVFAEDGRRGVATESIVSRAASSRGARCAARSSAPTSASTRSGTWRTRSCSPAPSCGATPASAAPSSTAASRCPGAPSSATTPPRTADATPSPRAEWWWSPPARSASSIPITSSESRHP